MKKKTEIFLVLIIIVFIILLEIVTNYIAEKSVEKMTNELYKLNEDIQRINMLKDEINLSNEEQEKMNKKASEFKESWLKEEKKLSIFSEHDELEKVTISVVELEENVKNTEYDEALLNGAQFLYWLNHFNNKDKLEIKTFF